MIVITLIIRFIYSTINMVVNSNKPGVLLQVRALGERGKGNLGTKGSQTQWVKMAEEIKALVKS